MIEDCKLKSENSIWVNASAGTGKTTCLTERIKALLLNGTDPEKILCVTFSNIAAKEINDRLLGDLSRWNQLEDKQLGSELKKYFDRKVTLDDLSEARMLLFKVHEKSEKISIQTIHSFCNNLLKRFLFEAKIPLFYEIINEVEQDRIKLDAFNLAMQDLDKKQREDLQEIFADMKIVSSLKKSNSSKVYEVLKRLGSVGVNTKIIADEYNIKYSETPEIIKINECKDSSFNKEGLYRLSNVLAEGNTTQRRSSEKIVHWLDSSEKKRCEIFERYIEVFLTKTLGFREHLKKNLNKSNFDILSFESKRLIEVIHKKRKIESYKFNSNIITALDIFSKYYQKLKFDIGYVDFDDLVGKAKDLLSSKEESHWVRYKLDGGFNHILIDEAQDTSPPQWEIIKALTDEMLERENTSLFVVGDRKQSIYSFQGVEIDYFDKMKIYFKNKLESLNKKYKEETLDINYRSSPAILEYVDYLSNSLSGINENGRYKIIHKSAHIGRYGIVKIHRCNEKEASNKLKNNDWESWKHQKEPYIRKKSPLSNMANKITKAIKELIEQGSLSNGQKIKASDITILLKKRSELWDEIKNQITASGIKVSANDKIQLNHDIVIKDLMSIGRFYLLPNDNFNLSILLKGPFIENIDDNKLLSLIKYDTKKSLWDNLNKCKDNNPEIKKACDFLENILKIKAGSSPSYFYKSLIHKHDGKSKLSARLDPNQVDETIKDFLIEIKDYEKLNTASLEGFIYQFENNETQINRTGNILNDNTINMRTIHSVKGDQFPVVFLIVESDAARVEQEQFYFPESVRKKVKFIISPSNANNSFDYMDELKEKEKIKRNEEYHRLLYVASTRAEERLYIFDHGSKSLKDLPLIENNEIISGKITASQTIEAEKNQNLGNKDYLPAYFNENTRYNSITESISPSKIGTDYNEIKSPLQAEDRNRKFFSGRHIHKLLQIIPDLVNQDHRNISRKYLSQKSIGLNDKEIRKITDEIMSIYDRSEFSHLFSHSSMPEVPFSFKVGDRLINGQIDRLVIMNDELLIVDYKTDIIIPEAINDVDSSYLMQMSIYYFAMKEIYPLKKLRCSFLWTKKPSIMNIPDKILFSHWKTFLEEKVYA